MRRCPWEENIIPDGRRGERAGVGSESVEALVGTELASAWAGEPGQPSAEDPIDTLIDLLEFRALESPALAAFLFEDEPFSYGALWERIHRCACGLLIRGLGRGDRVVLALPNGPDFFASFYGVQRAGGIPVPVYPDSGPQRLRQIAGLCGAAAVMVSSPVAARLRRGGDLGAFGERVLTVAEAAEVPPEAELPGSEMPRLRPEDIAFLQYTSGSTGDPKGVQITHANLLDNIRQMIAGMGITESEVFVSWLPVCHDMGLILMTMVPFYLAARLILLPAELTHVRRWLAAIAEQRGTFTAAPDFAYRLCLRAIRDPGELDLSSLRVALDAAEPVRAGTLTGFETAFGLAHVVVAGYGLAEATVGVSMWPPGRPAKVDERGFVSVGAGFPGVELAIEDGGVPALPGEVGEILVRSPANTRGYFANPDATARLLREDGFLHTGDLGYLDEEGDLFIVGRTKNLIVRAGQSLSPQEVEESVEALAFVRRAAAVGIDRGDAAGEQVYVFAEPRGGRAAEEPFEEWVIETVQSFHDRFGFRPGRVILLAPRAIPLTANGKIRHSRLREIYLDGRLRAEGKILFPE